MNARLVRIIKRLALLGLVYLAVLAGTYVYSELAEPPGIRVDQANKPLLTPSERAALHPDTRAGLEAYEAGDYTRAHALWLPRAEAGDAEAMFRVGRLYDRGEGVGKDHEVAAAWFQQASTLGHPTSMFSFAHMLDSGEGVSKNPTLSRKYYELAFAAGVSNAAISIGLDYRRGTGVEQNLASEIKWFSAAARLCNARALYRIGVAYYEGEIVEKNRYQSYTLIHLSQLNGNKNSNDLDVYFLVVIPPWTYIQARERAWTLQQQTCAQAKSIPLTP